MQTIRRITNSLATAKQYMNAMQALDAKAVRVTADGTWVAGGGLVYPRGSHVFSVGRNWVIASVDGKRVRMQPHDNQASLPAELTIIAELNEYSPASRKEPVCV